MTRVHAAVGAIVFALTTMISAKSRPFTVVEATISEMQDALKHKRVTSRQLVQQYLDRIQKYNGTLNAIVTVNPQALEEADARDRERAQRKIRGPLHGIPIALKDIIQSAGMPTTGGALAFKSLIPPYEATITKNLRDAGAIIIAKTNLTELANWVATAMPGNYNPVAGYGMNPYDPRPDPREGSNDGRPALNVAGSSSGTGTAANFWAANVGTETSGSILSPSNQNMLAAIKPTVGRISRYGVIPITADQDTAGPMARTVADAAILFGVLEGGVDPNDSATSLCSRVPKNDYTRFLKKNALKGARIGIPRAYYYDALRFPGDTSVRGGLNPDQAALMANALDVLKKRGAVIVDPVDIPSIVSANPDENLLLWPQCSGPAGAKGRDDHCSVVLKYGMKRDFNIWLERLGPAAPVKTLTELREWNLAHEADGAIKYGQAQLDISDEMDLDADRARYEIDRARDLQLSRTNGIDAAMKEHKLDALLFPGNSASVIGAKAGYPTVIVPFGFVPNAPTPAFPEGFEARPSPYGVSFTGMACSEPRLLALAYAFEQATKGRIPPRLFP